MASALVREHGSQRPLMKRIALDPNEQPSDHTVELVARYIVGYTAGANRTTPRHLEGIPKSALYAAVDECVVNADELADPTYERFLDDIHEETFAIIGEDPPEKLLSNR